jgi:hypothetical protein
MRRTDLATWRTRCQTASGIIRVYIIDGSQPRLIERRIVRKP